MPAYLVLVVLVLVAAAGCSGGEGGAVQLRGLVTDAAGRGVPGARVLVVSAPVPVPDIAALSGPDGGFALNVPAPGSYEVAAYAEDASGAGLRAQARVEAGATRAEPVRLVLLPG